jgi:hypothetical protein
MGVSTNGQICFGVKVVGDTDLPWWNGDYDWDIESWWREVNGYVPPFEIWDDDGEYVNDKPSDEQFDVYFGARRAWDKEHPLSVYPVNYCSHDYPEWILAVPGTLITANRGYPVVISRESLPLIDEEAYKSLLGFCVTYGIEYEGEPSWWLSSYWG